MSALVINHNKQYVDLCQLVRASSREVTVTASRSSLQPMLSASLVTVLSQSPSSTRSVSRLGQRSECLQTAQRSPEVHISSHGHKPAQQCARGPGLGQIDVTPGDRSPGLGHQGIEGTDHQRRAEHQQQVALLEVRVDVGPEPARQGLSKQDDVRPDHSVTGLTLGHSVIGIGREDRRLEPLEVVGLLAYCAITLLKTPVGLNYFFLEIKPINGCFLSPDLTSGRPARCSRASMFWVYTLRRIPFW